MCCVRPRVVVDHWPSILIEGRGFAVFKFAKNYHPFSYYHCYDIFLLFERQPFLVCRLNLVSPENEVRFAETVCVLQLFFHCI